MATHTSKHWTEEEKMTLLLYIDEPTQVLCEKLGRSRMSVSVMKSKMIHKYSSCNEDCENCPYPDCVRPVSSF